MSNASNLIPVILLFLVTGVIAFVGYQIYLYTLTLKSTTKEHMAKHNVSVTHEGLKVGVKDISAEAYGDKLQKGLVNTWNEASSQPATSVIGSTSVQGEIKPG
jgi:hypothetical protein